MFPWGHAAVGYLLYVALVRYRFGERPEGAPVIALAIGTQFPDLVDKPLAWYLGVLPSGRSLAHSVFVAMVLISLVYWLASRFDRSELGVAFALGYLSHLLGDVVYPLFRGEWEAVGILLWPIVPQPGSETDYTILEVLLQATESAVGIFEIVLFVFTTGLWIAHRGPGLWLCLRAIGSVVPKR